MDKRSALTGAITALVTLLGALGAFHFKLEYVKGANQESMGKLIVTLTKDCRREGP